MLICKITQLQLRVLFRLLDSIGRNQHYSCYLFYFFFLALALKKVKYIRQLKECKVPKGTKKRSVEKMLLCLIKEGNPTYFCRKEPEYKSLWSFLCTFEYILTHIKPNDKIMSLPFTYSYFFDYHFPFQKNLCYIPPIHPLW